jgi:4-amino-4-deoxy-L-arabinose transferase-like glycosyltransferase
LIEAHDVDTLLERSLNEMHHPKPLGFSVRGWLLALFVVGMSLRLGLAFMLGLDAAPYSDSKEYDTYAWNLAQGNGYRGMSPGVTDPNHLTAHRAPGTSILWAGLYRVFGHRYSVVRITNCLLSAITIFFIYGIGKYCFSERVGIFSASAFAIWPTSLLYSTQLASEPLFTLLLLWYLLVSLHFGKQPTLVRAVAAGLLLGLSILTRGNAVFMIPLAGLWAWWQFQGQRKSRLIGLTIPIVATVTLIPWSVRNYAVFHEFLPFGTAAGDVFLGGNNRVVATDPVNYGYWVSPTSLPEYRDQLNEPNDEVRRDRLEKKLTWQWLEEHPGLWWYLFQAKVRRSLTPILDPDSPRLYRIGMLLSWGPVLVLSMLSIFPTAVSFFRSKHPGWILHLAVLDFVLTAVVFWGAARFRYPVEGLFLMLAFVSAFWLWDKLRGRSRRTWRAADIRGRVQKAFTSMLELFPARVGPN